MNFSRVKFKSISFLTLIGLLILMPLNNSQAWGYSVHKELVSRSNVELPTSFVEFVNSYLKELKEASIYPDQNKAVDPTEGPKHYDDSDVPHKDINISSSHPDYKLGVVSWAVLNSSKLLTKALVEINATKIIHAMGLISHYVTDAHQPFHATENYDGQLTGNEGIHSRFETILVEKNWDQLFSNFSLNSPNYISDPYNATKQVIKSGLELVPTILKADDDAKASGNYWKSFFNLTRGILHNRMVLASQLTTDLWYTSLNNSNMISYNFTNIINPASSSLTTTTGTNPQAKTSLSPSITNNRSVNFLVSVTVISLASIIILFRKKTV